MSNGLGWGLCVGVCVCVCARARAQREVAGWGQAEAVTCM